MSTAFFQVGKRIINQYEVREVCLDETLAGIPTATVTYKDGTKVTVKGTRVPAFAAWLTHNPATKVYKTFCYQDDQY